MNDYIFYSDFVKAVQTARKNTAKFFRVDLHVHTIESHDFPSLHQKQGFVKAIPLAEFELKNNPEEFKKQFIA